MKYELISLHTVMHSNSEMGGLSFIEGMHDVPFRFQGMSCISHVEVGEQRDFCAHKRLSQLLFCPSGCVEVQLKDGNCTETVMLDKPSEGLIIYPGVWRELTWKKRDSVLCAAVSEGFDRDEIIQDYDVFLSFTNSAEA